MQCKPTMNFSGVKFFHTCSTHWLERISCHSADSWNVFFSMWILKWFLNSLALSKFFVTVVTIEWFFFSVDSFMVSQLASFVGTLVTMVTVEWFTKAKIFCHSGDSLYHQTDGMLSQMKSFSFSLNIFLLVVFLMWAGKKFHSFGPI